METLPAELHGLIIDSVRGVKTIHALSLTSSRFHALAAPYRFHTLVLSDSSRQPKPEPAALLRVLEGLPEGQRRIYRVLVTLHDSRASALPQILRILQLARPEFPYLEAITLHGLYPPLPSSSSPKTTSESFPALRFLDVGGNPHPVGLPLPHTWLRGTKGTKVVRLRVSGLQGAVGFAKELRDVLASADEVHHPLPLTILLELLPLPRQPLLPSAAGIRLFRRDVEMRGILSGLASEGSGKAYTFVSVKDVQAQAQGGCASGIEEEWLERESI
ncbi:hypothetical protein C8F01DRAFT_1228287 [Mycena amicta]|nr:hypothetical protein C8F01DRAFT_1228287 [Mycena amicta]